MASVISPGSTTMVMNGTRSAYEEVASTSQENTSANKNRPNGARQNSAGSTRSPLSTLAPNRKDSGSVNGRLAPHNRVEELGQREGNLIRSGSEPDSLLDLYKSNPSSANVSQHQPDSDIPENMYMPAEDDPEGWIHRDKLAKIESEELQAAGINLAKARRNVTKPGPRDTSRGRRSEDRNPSEQRRPEVEESVRPRLTEPVEEAEEDERSNWDFRTPEEIAESTPSPIYSNPVLRKSGSKIPVLTSSPLPIPQESIERHTPLVRKRTISNSMTPEEGIPVLKTRMRRGSTGSQPLQDEGDSTMVTTPTASKLLTPKSASPTKSRPKTAQGSPPDGSSGRKTSSNTTRKPSTNAKPAPTPATTQQRPGTRSGELDRPRTAVNRPEGDPPWLATMYKPDPRLPPDQQIIPTHARRQQQAQWEDEGAVPRTYDRNFSPLAIHTGNGQVKMPSPIIPSSAPIQEKEGAEGDDGGSAWPLKAIGGLRNSGTGSLRPDTGGSANGGYSTMPRVTNPVQSPRMGSITSVPTQPPTRMQVQRMQQDDNEEKVKEKSCGCCVVM